MKSKYNVCLKEPYINSTQMCETRSLSDEEFADFEPAADYAEPLRELYEETIVMGIIKGFFTRTVNFRKSGDLITEKNQKHFDYLVDRYKKALQADGENMFYQKMLQWLYTSKELGAVSAN